MNKKYRAILLVLFIVSIGIRLSLALVNREANDDHMQVVKIMLQRGRLPVKDDCEECFQPKLYHSIVASTIKLFSITDQNFQIITGQLINLLASIAMLWVLWQFIKILQVEWDGLKLLTFGLVALNPRLVAINAQATNDTFVITFSSIALFFAFLFIIQKKYRYLLLTIIFSILTVLSKINGITTVFAIGLAFFLDTIIKRDEFAGRKIKGFLLLGIYLIIVSISVVSSPLSQFIINYQKYGSPVTLNIAVPPQPFPKLLEKTDTYKPGILSIQDAFLTFKLRDLLIYPQLTTKEKNYPVHRTSFWTILYARANFIQYNQFPPSWETSSPTIKRLGRRIYLLALLPLIIILLGFILETKNLYKWIMDAKKTDSMPTSSGLLLLTWLGYLAFQMAYALRYRTYYIIKDIYIYPAILALTLFFVIGYNYIYRLFLRKKLWLNYLFVTPMIFLLVSTHSTQLLFFSN